MDRILRRSLGVSETAPTDATVKPAPPKAAEPIEDTEFEFDDSHMRLDPEALGLKVGKPAEKDARVGMSNLRNGHNVLLYILVREASKKILDFAVNFLALKL